MREACGDAHMKTILATGECGTMANVHKASMVCMMAGRCDQALRYGLCRACVISNANPTLRLHSFYQPGTIINIYTLYNIIIFILYTCS